MSPKYSALARFQRELEFNPHLSKKDVDNFPTMEDNKQYEDLDKINNYQFLKIYFNGKCYCFYRQNIAL